MTNEPFLRGYRVLKIPIVDENGNPTWPKLFPHDAIEALRVAVGARHFSAQMMLEYISLDRARLAPESLHIYSHEFDLRTAKLGDVLITGVSAYWDPSTARRTADSSVCVLVLRDDKSRRAFIHDIRYLCVNDEDMHPMATQCGYVLDFMFAHSLRHIGIEVNGIGNAMPEILRDVATRRGQSLVVQKVINHEKKERRILDAIEPMLSTGRLFAHERVMHSRLMDEFADWTPATGGALHDDGLDAIAGALRATAISVRPRGAAMRPISAKTDFKV